MQENIVNPGAHQNLESRSLILKSALGLFNERGTEMTSMNDVALASGFSNDEVHLLFKNKKSLIRGLFYEIEVFSVRELWQISPANRDVRFSDFMQFYFGSFAKFRFFFREFSMLIQQDPILAHEWRSSYERLLSIMQEALNGWIKQGLVKPFATVKDAEAFIEMMWITAAFSPVHIHARRGKSSPDYIREVNSYVVKFLYPYHTEKGQRVLDLFGAN
jgi:AcrR family transcriptional regulator